MLSLIRAPMCRVSPAIRPATKLADTVALHLCFHLLRLRQPDHDRSGRNCARYRTRGSDRRKRHWRNLRRQKVLCRTRRCRDVARSRSIIRPVHCWAHDRSDRFTYWPVRVADGGGVGTRSAGTTGTIHRCALLAAWTVRMVEQQATGVYNTIGPEPETTMGATLESCRRISGSNAAFTWVDEAFLLENEVGAYVEMPLWVPEEYRGNDAFS